MPRKLTLKEMYSLKDLGQSEEDMRELHRTLSELALTERYQRALQAAAGRGARRKDNANPKGKRKLETRLDAVDIAADFDSELGRSTSPDRNQLLCSGDTDRIDRSRPKQLRFADVVDVVYYCEFNNNATVRRCREPLADENDQQARSYRKRFITSPDKDFLLLCQSLSPPHLRGIYSYGLLNRDQELTRVERDLVKKKRRPLYDLFRK